MEGEYSYGFGKHLYPRTITVGGSQHGDGESYPKVLGANSKV